MMPAFPRSFHNYQRKKVFRDFLEVDHNETCLQQSNKSTWRIVREEQVAVKGDRNL